jgi:hypothetical protein
MKSVDLNRLQILNKDEFILLLITSTSTELLEMLKRLNKQIKLKLKKSNIQIKTTS